MKRANCLSERLVIYTVVILLLLLIFLFCSKSPTNVDNTETDLNSVTAAVEVLGSADSLYQAILEAQGRSAAVTATVNYLNSFTSVVEAGMSPDSSVYVFYENGLLGCVYNPNLGSRAESGQSVKKKQAPLGGGEVTPGAVILLPSADEFGTSREEEIAQMLNDCFGHAEPATDIFINDQVTVAKVANVLASGPGVLFWLGHAAKIPLEPGSAILSVAFMTGESYSSDAMANKIVNTYKNSTLGGAAARELIVVSHKTKHYLAVLPAFVSSHANFDHMEGSGNNYSKSIVYACCCNSADYLMLNSFLTAGAEVYLGWNKTVMSNFAGQIHKKYFEAATDTCTASEAYALCSGSTDPKTGAGLEAYYGDKNVMIRAQMNLSKDGSEVHGYSVGVISHEATTVNCWTDPDEDSKACAVAITFPGNGPGSFNCNTDDDAVIAVVQLSTAKLFVVEEDLIGVHGTINVKRNIGDFLSGEFSGTLGYWTPDQNPHEVPPSETMDIENGFFKHTGKRM